jgi:hypothetical protein
MSFRVVNLRRKSARVVGLNWHLLRREATALDKF